MLQLTRRRICLCVTAIIAIACLSYIGIENLNQSNTKGKPAQTDVDRARHCFDANGVPYLKIAGVGDYYHPGGIGVYALEYAGLEQYDKNRSVPRDMKKFKACIEWLEENLVEDSNGSWIWEYQFDNTYNDITIKAPWASAFGQALGIEALVAAYKIDGDPKHLEIAEKAASVLFKPVEQGGLLFKKGDDIWFEEIPSPKQNPPHILNGHMRTLMALKNLADATGEKKYYEWFDRGCATLERWLPLYDNGYWLRYDLNPKKSELLFRFNNPYGFKLPNVAVDKIIIRDPATHEEVCLDVGAANDSRGGARIAGNDWGQRGELDGRTVRRLTPVIPATSQEEADGQMHSPGTYFYLKLPSQWKNNLRTDWFELEIIYKDERAGNLTVQLRSIAPGSAFRDMRDGDLLLTGSGKWHNWKVPVRVTDLGWWVGASYAEKHYLYLEELSKYRGSLKPWATVAKGYYNLGQISDLKSYNIVTLEPIKLPQQTPMLPIYSLDKKGVVRQHRATQNSKFSNTGLYDPAGDRGEPVYHYFVIAEQLMLGSDLKGGAYSAPSFNRSEIKRKPALDWLLDSENYVNINGAATYRYVFDNAYNDVYTSDPWQSAFGQAYVVKALTQAIDDRLDKKARLVKHLKKVVNAYNLAIDNGGVVTITKNKKVFAEEVPNATHILNAHLVSATALHQSQKYVEAAFALKQKLLDSLYDYLHCFDTGYWSEYDKNPKKEILFQIDWIWGKTSPAIDEIYLQNPQTETATRIDVGSPGDTSYPNVSGIDWKSTETVDGRTVRHFANGYQLRSQSIKGGTRHNVFFLGALPERSYEDYFDVPPHHLVITYKDESPGEFVIKTQAINEGNSLRFAPLRGGVLKCTGDGKWKRAVFTLRPQDMGWYMGPDYQVFHIQQLRELAKETGSWFFAQYAEKWQYYLDAYQTNKNPIVEMRKATVLDDVAMNGTVVRSSPTYPGFGVENALDGDPFDDYVAGIEGPLPQMFIIQLKHRAAVKEIQLTWESDNNYAIDYLIEAVDAKGNPIRTLAQVAGQSGQVQEIEVSPASECSYLKLTIKKVSGQQRMLLRQIKVLAEKNYGEENETKSTHYSDVRIYSYVMLPGSFADKDCEC